MTMHNQTTRDPRPAPLARSTRALTAVLPPSASVVRSAHEPTAVLPQPPPFKVDDTWQRHLAGNTAPVATPSTLREGTQILGSAHYQPVNATAALNVNNNSRRPPLAYHARLRMRRSVGGRVRPIRFAEVRSSFVNQILGVVLVGLIGCVSVWGFWELRRRLGTTSERSSQVTESTTRPRDGDSTRSIKKPKTRAPRNGTPAITKQLTHKPTSNTVSARASKPRTDRQSKPRVATLKKPIKARYEKPEVSVASTATTADDPNLAVEAVEIKRARVQETGDAPTEAAAPTATEAPRSQAVSGKGGIMISSDPAAEIFVDGKRLGTTVDHTASSGWINVRAGSHVLELRRQGYQSYRTRFDLGQGEQRSFPRVVLDINGNGGNSSGSSTGGGASEGNSANATRGAVLTLRVNFHPAQVTIRNLDTNATQIFSLRAPSKMIRLDSGRYHVRVDYKGETKERDLNLTSGSQLTFAADFKDE